MRDFNEIANNFNKNHSDFKLKGSRSTSRYIKPKKDNSIPYKRLKYKNAEKLAKDLDFKALDRVFVVVDGSFIFGDFIEAFIVNHNILVKEITLSTLSMNQDNVDSLKNLIDAGYIEKLNLIVSDYFYSHEISNLIKYAYEKLDHEDRFQLAVCRTHTKIYQMETEGGKFIVMHGSANLRSSDNLEQFVIEDSKEIYDFNQFYFKNILERYKTINKSIKSKELWQVVAKDIPTSTTIEAQQPQECED